MTLGILRQIILTADEVTSFFWRRFVNSDKFTLLISIFIISILLDQLYGGLNLIRLFDTNVSNYEASIAILLSGLLVVLYNKQQKIQNSQKELLKKQTEFQEVQHQPILIFEEIWLDGDEFKAIINNVGNGPALNMYLFMGSGEPEQDPKRIHESSELINGSSFTNTILSSSESTCFSVDINYDTFPRSNRMSGRVQNIAKNYEMSSERLQGRPTIYLAYDDVTGESHYVKLIKVIENIPTGASYEDYLIGSDLHDLTTGRRDISISKIAWEELS